MRFAGSVTIPAGTAQADAQTAKMPVCQGTVTQVRVLFPAGHVGLTRLQIYYHEQQIWPTSPGEVFRGDDQAVVFGESFVLDREPFVLVLKGWAPDSTLQHTIYVEVTVQIMARIQPGAWSLVELPGGLA